MNFLQRSKSYGTLLALFLSAFATAMAQTKTVSGTVRSDPDNKPIVGVSVQVKGGNLGTSTDENGKFTLSGIAENSVLVFTSTGFQAKEMRVAGNAIIDVTLNT